MTATERVALPLGHPGTMEPGTGFEPAYTRECRCTVDQPFQRYDGIRGEQNTRDTGQPNPGIVRRLCQLGYRGMWCHGQDSNLHWNGF